MDGANAASADSPSRASSLARRIASVTVLIPVIVAAAWWYWTTAALVLASIVIALLELYSILERGGYQPRRIVGLALGLALGLAMAARPLIPQDLLGLVVTAGVILSLSYELLPRDRSTSLASWALSFGGAFYIGVLLSSYTMLRQLDAPLAGGPLAPLGIPAGSAWVMTALAITWLQDTAAYFVGRSLGRTRMAPILSPKKTWEGAAGGFIASVLTALLATALLGLPISYLAAAALGAAAGVAGPLGDLAESLIKRQIGVKDSGQLIPGHGGILDRIDSLIFVGPVIYYGAALALGLPL